MPSSNQDVNEDGNADDTSPSPQLLDEPTSIIDVSTKPNNDVGSPSLLPVIGQDEKTFAAMEEWLRRQEEEEQQDVDQLQEIFLTNTDDAAIPPRGEIVVAEQELPNQQNREDEREQLQPPQPPLVEDVDEGVLAHVPPEELAAQQQAMMQLQLMNMQQQQQQLKGRRHWLFTYRPMSFLLCLGLLWYALRTRKQYYFAAVFLSHSKIAYVIFGNTIIATAIVIFDCLVYIFFRTSSINGLRIQEAEGLQDFFRWNITETCFAFTMFRYELNIITAVQFVFLILLKCLHYIAAQREQHLRMTEDAIITNTPSIGGLRSNRTTSSTSISSYMTSLVFMRSSHVSIITFFFLLQMVDMYIIQQSILHIYTNGASVKILFAFEAAILLVSTYSHIILYMLHFIDCLIQYGHDVKEWYVASKLLHPWKEYKATLIFAIELQAQAINFLFYCTFFCIVLTFYGLPINLFREVYMSFMKFKERLTSFFHYRQLMASMNRFRTATEDELNEIGRTCIICRDEMTSGHDCKKLPVCGHTFHKSCLREWLVQQQTCPTCRADIAAMEALEASRAATANAASQRTVTATSSDNEDNNVTGTSVAPSNNAESDATNEASVAASTKEKKVPNERTACPNNDTISNGNTSVQGEAVNTDEISKSALAVVVDRDAEANAPCDIRQLNPTLYKVIDNNNVGGIPNYTMIPNGRFDENSQPPQPTRILSKNTLIVVVASWYNPISGKQFLQLPDHTWIMREHVQLLCVIKNYNEKIKL